jgi:hypothetical protein
VVYDRHAHRWVATGLDALGTHKVILAVSLADSPLPLGAGWTNRLLDFSGLGPFTDFPTLGLDDNGIYVTALQSDGTTNRAHTIVAIKKPEIYQGIFRTNRIDIFTSNTVPIWTIQPAVSFDNAATNDYAWFAAKGLPALGTNYQGGAIYYHRMQWSGTNISLAEPDWVAVTNGANYRDFYDLDGTNGTTLGTGTGSRLCSTVLRGGWLWTCQAVGLSGTNGTYTGDQSGATKDREGVQWLKFKVEPGTGGLTYAAHGRFFDQSASNASKYVMPSLAVNCAGDMVSAFSGVSSSNYVTALVCPRLANGYSPIVPQVIQPGLVGASLRLGDYSATTLDPTDDWSFWTVQEYTNPQDDPGGQYPWRTVIARVKPQP